MAQVIIATVIISLHEMSTGYLGRGESWVLGGGYASGLGSAFGHQSSVAARWPNGEKDKNSE